jgi:UDP-2,4-diacetamido-2,4,6-trideoxy-beta-L-idose 2-epimerase
MAGSPCSESAKQRDVGIGAMKRRIAVFTGTRAEYGLLFWLMNDIQSRSDLELQVLVSGTHLSPEFGMTVNDIESDGFMIDARVEMLLSSNTAVGIVKSVGLGTIGFADALDRLQPDMLVVLGDRFEALAVTQAALVMRIPVAHIHGGELTEGAYDDSIRNAITKMASLHFTAAEAYRRRVIQMGEAPDTVFNVGAVGLEHLTRQPILSLPELSERLNFKISDSYFLVTYHPATVADEHPETTFRALLEALDRFPSHQAILTFPNADNGGREIIPILLEYAKSQSQRILAIPSLGSERYLATLKGAAAVVGNSSSGIIEAPSAGVPTVNIGERQGGRLAADSVIHCGVSADNIAKAMSVAISPEFSRRAASVSNPYGSGNSSKMIVDVIEATSHLPSKRFYNLEFHL